MQHLNIQCSYLKWYFYQFIRAREGRRFIPSCRKLARSLTSPVQVVFHSELLKRTTKIGGLFANPGVCGLINQILRPIQFAMTGLVHIGSNCANACSAQYGLVLLAAFGVFLTHSDGP